MSLKSLGTQEQSVFLSMPTGCEAEKFEVCSIKTFKLQAKNYQVMEGSHLCV